MKKVIFIIILFFSACMKKDTLLPLPKFEADLKEAHIYFSYEDNNSTVSEKQNGCFEIFFGLKTFHDQKLLENSEIIESIQILKPDGSFFSFVSPDSLLALKDDVYQGYETLNYPQKRRIWKLRDYSLNSQNLPMTGTYQLKITKKDKAQISLSVPFTVLSADPITGFPVSVNYDRNSKTVSWTGAAGASGYRIMIFLGENTDDLSKLVYDSNNTAIPNSSLILPDILVEGNKYSVVVDALDTASGKTSDAGFIHRSKISSLSTIIDSEAPFVADKIISAGSVGETSMTLSWSQAEDNISTVSALRYKLVKSSLCGDLDTEEKINALSGDRILVEWTENILTKQVTGLSAGITYCFNVAVRDEAGNISLYTPKQQTTTLINDISSPVVSDKSIAVSSVTAISLTLSWNAAVDNVSAQNALQYKVVKASAETAVDTIIEADSISGNDIVMDWTPGILSKTVTGLSDNTVYYFNVIAKDEAGNKSIYTAKEQQTLMDQDLSAPTAGSGIVFLSTYARSMSLSWGGAVDNITISSNLSYKLVSSFLNNITTVSDALANGTVIMDWTVSQTSYSASRLKAKSGYYFTVLVKDGTGNTGIYPVVDNMTDYWVTETGVSKCYNADSEISCPATGEAFYGQDGNYSNTPKAKNFSDNGDGTVTDNVTRLVWKKNTETGIYTNAAAVTVCDNLDFAGRTGWRLPSVNELTTIVSFEKYNPSIDTAYFLDTQTGAPYWTSNIYQADVSKAYYVLFQKGEIAYYDKIASIYVRCVSGGEIPFEPRFTDNLNGTIKDNHTGLLWERCPYGRANTTTCVAGETTQKTWLDALSVCENLELGERNDWRLPSISELRSVAVWGGIDSPLGVFSLRDLIYEFWSSTRSSGYYWSLNGYTGASSQSSATSSLAILCVTGSQ
ncbi:MAG TPA: hypothetical protein DHW82_06485 [Spirochaetia bacterium]|nr:hypothetical protein [Spirochaetia bacterium]